MPGPVDVGGVVGYATAVPEYSRHQKEIIRRYYDQRDSIMLGKLQEIVTELYLATAEGSKKRLWKQAAAAMKNLKVSPSVAEHIVASGKAEVLAEYLRRWLHRPAESPGQRPTE